MEQEAWLYWQLFLDNLYTHSFLPIHYNWMFATMNSFPYYNYNVMLACAMAASFLGGMINYIVGLLFKYKLRPEIVSNHIVIMLLLVGTVVFGWLNIIGAFLSFSCGYIGIKARLALPAILLSHVVYYLI